MPTLAALEAATGGLEAIRRRHTRETEIMHAEGDMPGTTHTDREYLLMLHDTAPTARRSEAMTTPHTPTAGPELTVREAGRRGGSTTSQRYRASGFYQAIGAAGGAMTAAKHGPEHYERIGQLGGARTRALVAKGKAAEAKGLVEPEVDRHAAGREQVRREVETKCRDLEDRFARLLGGDGPLMPQHEKGCTGACRFCLRAAINRVEAT